ncbi:hypothetical protein QZH41_009784 [Actinostola sp. cb2023]|nr:hypothetical protein QZH41_009784 [Actinostola sp. cb2023]
MSLFKNDGKGTHAMKFFEQLKSLLSSYTIQRHSLCPELCMDYAFGQCSLDHPQSCADFERMFDVMEKVQEELTNIDDAVRRNSLSQGFKRIVENHREYIAHLIRTKHQGDYYRFVTKNLSPGEVVVIIDYKMKLELGQRSRENQREWFGKRGISIHGFFVLAQANNGPHYHNSGLLCYLSEVNRVFNFTLKEYNYFEAGEGKSVLDSHFAHISHKVVRWVRLGNDLESGEQAAELIKVCILK